MTRALLLLVLSLPLASFGQPTPGGSCSLSATCAARRIAVKLGNLICLNYSTCTSTISASATTSGTVFNSAVANSGTNAAYIFNTTNSLSGNTLIFSVQSAGSQKFAIQDDGSVNAPGYGNTSGAPQTQGFWFSGSNTFVTAAGNGNAVVLQSNSGLDFGRFLQTGLSFAANDAAKVTFSATDSTASPGNATVNKPSGQAAFDIAGTAVVVSNTNVSATSVCVGVMQETDATCTHVVSAIPAANSVTFNANAACTAATNFGWVCFN